MHAHPLARRQPPFPRRLLARAAGLASPGLRAAVAVMLLTTSLEGQRAPRVLTGTVADSATGVGIAGAEVVVQGTTARAVTDQRGTFTLAEGVPDQFALAIRRLGFVPRLVPIAAVVGPVDIRLVPQLQALHPVVVRAERTRYTGRLAGYYERLEHRSGGQFITRADLERERPTQLTDMLQRAPGVRITRGRPGAPGVRMRGRDCSPLVWLDGSALGMGEVDLDGFSPESLEGIEMYLGASGAPSRYQAARGKSECGTILLWSRRTDTEPRPYAAGAPPADLEALIASFAIFTADQVDTPAALDTVASTEVVYPAAMRASATSGHVVAEFVVDSVGRPEPAHFGIVSSTNSLFADAVRDAVLRAVFKPALRRGRPVRQLVRQPYDFTAPSRERRPD